MRLKTAIVLSILLSFAFVSQSFPNTPINDEHLVTSGETLWSIAELKKPDEVSIWQVMDGIYKANKFLFEKKNPMDISEGTKLIIPNNSFFLEQSGFYVADTLGLDIYQRENIKASINNIKINNIRIRYDLIIHGVHQSSLYCRHVKLQGGIPPTLVIYYSKILPLKYH